MRGQSWIFRWSLLHLCCSLLMASGALEALAQAPRRIAAPLQLGELECHNNQTKIRPVGYALAVDLKNLSEPKPQPSVGGAVEGTLVVWVKDSKGVVYPIIQPGQQSSRYQALCSYDPKQLARLPTKLRITGGTNAKELSERLAAISQAPWNELHKGVAAPLRYNAGVHFIEWPYVQLPLPSQGLLVSLIQGYIAQGGHTLSNEGTDHIGLTAMLLEARIPWPARANTANLPVQPPLGPSQDPTQPPQGPPAQSQSDTEQAAPTEQEQPSIRQPPTGRPVSRNDQVSFTIGFQNGAPWKDTRLDQDQRISSYGYCADDQIERDGRNLTYRLQCTPGEDGKVPIGIRGFHVVLVNQQEAKQIDTKLEVVGFRRAYPPTWGRVSSALVEVPSGPLAQVLRTNLRLDQGIADASPCTSAISVSVASIVNQSIGIENLPTPCRRYQLVFERGLTDETAQVLSGCVAGLSGLRPIQQSQVTCWYHRDQGGQFNLPLQMRAGFAQLPLRISQTQLDQGVIHYDFNALAALLVPVWPYRGASPFEAAVERGEAPPFVAKSVEYYNDGTSAPCGQPVPVNGQVMPNLRAAGCKQIPVGAAVTFVKGAAVPHGAPPKAFLDTYPDRYDIRSVAPTQRNVDVSNLKKQLRILFNRESVAEYKVRFRTANATAPAGLYVFAGSGEKCGRPAVGTFVPFENPDVQKTWPQVGAVYGVRSRDGTEQPILTACAPARVAEQDGIPYLTFDVEAKIANGPRRIVIVANSMGLQQGGTSDQVREGLRRLVDLVEAERGKKAPLSPISVYFMDSNEALQTLFTGEDAARKPAEAKAKLLGIDRAAPPMPDLNYLRQQPEIRDSIDRLIVIMDGSVPIDDHLTQAGGFARRLGAGGGSFTIFIKGNCQKWDPEVTRIECFQLTSQPQSLDQLTRVLSTLVERRETRADEGRAPPAASRTGNRSP